MHPQQDIARVSGVRARKEHAADAEARPDAGRYHAVLPAPKCRLGAIFDGDTLIRLDFLPNDAPLQADANARTAHLAAELDAYWADPNHVFDLPFEARGTAFRRRVGDVLSRIPRGTPTTYGQLAAALGSAPRAVGQACGANPLPILIPCHRVLGAKGLGGFMHTRDTGPLELKAWLLEHEAQ